MTRSDDRLIVAIDVPNAVEALALADRLGDAVSFYKIGLGMLTGGGLALANELKGEHGKRTSPQDGVKVLSDISHCSLLEGAPARCIRASTPRC